MTSGNVQRLTCSTKAGHPPAKLVWYKGQEMMESHYSLDGDTASSQITFVPHAQDDGSTLRCEASNSAIQAPFVNTIQLQVHEKTTTTTTEYPYDENFAYDDEYNDELHLRGPSLAVLL